MSELLNILRVQVATQAHVVRIAHEKQATSTVRPGVESAIAVPVWVDPAVVSGMSMEESQRREFRKYDPMHFYGELDLRTVETCVFNHEKLHNTLNIDEYLRASIFSYYLQDDAEIWWRSLHDGHPVSETWADFLVEFTE
ncbi:hypothetical protein Syun_025744 [Stephania yunnanensis]|uniref:Retrotransposon gag domain-containing protein n=1 Tax=Stephania yunnanensis TaxID=152371 RepID=A0AAP0HVJ2_9MAGN